MINPKYSTVHLMGERITNTNREPMARRVSKEKYTTSGVEFIELSDNLCDVTEKAWTLQSDMSRLQTWLHYSDYKRLLIL